MFYALLSLSFFGAVFGVIHPADVCSEVQTVPDFDVSKFLGRWYQVKTLVRDEIPGSCVITDFNQDESNVITIVNSFQNILGPQKSYRVARIPDLSEPGKLKTRYPFMPSNNENDYWILGTDYESYAVVYSCEKNNYIGKQASILTRERFPSKSVLVKAFAVAEKNDLSELSFAKTVQVDCIEQ